jgi:hypothetical protein
MEELMGNHVRIGIKRIFTPFIRLASFYWFISITIAAGMTISILEFFDLLDRTGESK